MKRRRGTWDVLVVGSGIAGLTAAWHAAQRGLAVGVLEGEGGVGGQVATVNVLTGWPAVDEVSGHGLAAALVQRLRAEGVELFPHAATAMTLQDGCVAVATTGATQRARKVVAATGAALRKLDIPGEQELQGKGVSHCADCDGALYRGQDVTVVGGGDAAIQEALVLSTYCRTVNLVVRSRIRAKRTFIEAAKGCANISFIWDSAVERIVGHEGVDGVVLRNLKNDRTTELACRGVFPFIGVTPQSAWLPPTLRTDADGCVVTNATLQSAEPTIYAVGALRSQYCGQLIDAAAEGAAAASHIAFELAHAPPVSRSRNRSKPERLTY